MIDLTFLLFYLGGALITGFVIALGVTWSDPTDEIDPDKLMPLMIVWPFTVTMLICLATVETINEWRKS
jgi:hypothetical protein